MARALVVRGLHDVQKGRVRVCAKKRRGLEYCSRDDGGFCSSLFFIHSFSLSLGRLLSFLFAARRWRLSLGRRPAYVVRLGFGGSPFEQLVRDASTIQDFAGRSEEYFLEVVPR